MNLSLLATDDLLAWLYVTVCQDADNGVAWAKVRTATSDALIALGHEIASENETPDPETWGKSAAAQAGLEAVLELVGGAEGGIPGPGHP